MKKARGSQGNLVYLVKGTDKGKAAWHYVLIDKLKLPLFREMLKTGRLDVARYGKVLYSGWGENPPAAMVESVKKCYS
jgi:hypothetical protein